MRKWGLLWTFQTYYRTSQKFQLEIFFFLDTPQIKPDGWFSIMSTDKTNMHQTQHNTATFPYAYDSVELYPVLLCIISLMGKGWRRRSFLSFQKPLQETIKTRKSPIPPVHCTNLSYQVCTLLEGRLSWEEKCSPQSPSALPAQINQKKSSDPENHSGISGDPALPAVTNYGC